MIRLLFKFVIWFIILFFLVGLAGETLHEWMIETFLDRNYDQNIDGSEKRFMVMVYMGLAGLLSLKLSQRWDLRCTWCGSRKLKVVTKKAQSAGYKHSNKDGSRDHRFNNNPELFVLFSEWKCKKCQATSACTHETGTSTSIYKKIISANLLVGGDGERTGKNY